MGMWLSSKLVPTFKVKGLPLVDADPGGLGPKLGDAVLDLSTAGRRSLIDALSAVVQATPLCGSAFGSSPLSGVASATVACICY